MLPFLADECFNGRIVRGLRERQPALDVMRVQDVAGLQAADDPSVLAYAATTGRALLTHDAATLTGYAYERVAAGLRMPGVFQVPRRLPIGQVIEELLIVAECSNEGEWENQVRFLPL